MSINESNIELLNFEENSIKKLNNVLNIYEKSKSKKLSNLDKIQEIKKYAEDLEIEFKLFLRDYKEKSKDKDKEEKVKTTDCYQKFAHELVNINEELAIKLFDEKMYKDCIETDKKIFSFDKQNHAALARLYKSFMAIGDKETAVIYGSFLKYGTKKNIINKYYKDLIKEIEINLSQVAEEYKNKSFCSELWKDMIAQTKKPKIRVRFCLLILCLAYLLKYYWKKI